MIISDIKKILFIHIPKTAGTSIANALEPFANERRLTPWRAIKRAIPGKVNPQKCWFEMHDTAQFVRSKLTPEVYDAYYKIAFVRSPYTHAYSHYQFLKTYAYARYARVVQNQTFEEYLAWRLNGSRRKYKTRIQRFVWMGDQSSFIYSPNGECLVDFIGRFEHINEDCDRLAERLGMSEFRLEHHRKGDYKKGLDIASLSEEARALIDQLYEADFKNFGYQKV